MRERNHSLRIGRKIDDRIHQACSMLANWFYPLPGSTAPDCPPGMRKPIID
jgi:hypothetical protein